MLSCTSPHRRTRDPDVEPTLLVAVYSDKYGIGLDGFKAAIQACFWEGRGDVVIQLLDFRSCHRTKRFDCHVRMLPPGRRTVTQWEYREVFTSCFSTNWRL